MASDAAQRESGGGGVSWALPTIVSIEALRVFYYPPIFHVIEHELQPVKEAVEITIQTAKPIPERALWPVLFIGDEPLTESEPAGPLRYRFFGVFPDRLKEGAPVALGWSTNDSPKIESAFQFRIHGELHKEGPDREIMNERPNSESGMKQRGKDDNVSPAFEEASDS
jgi:hypothetical protein